jgi:hypothetical protein
VPDARIDLAGTFADSAVFYAATQWKLRGGVCEQTTYKALLTTLALQSRSDFDWEFHKAELKWLPQPGDVVTVARTLSFDDMPPISEADPLPDFHVMRTETDSITNVVNVAFQRMFNRSGIQAYLLGDQFVSYPSLGVHKYRSNDQMFQFDFIRDVAMAEYLGLFYVLWLAYALPKPLWTTKLQTLELRKCDIVALDLSSTVTAAAPAGDVLGGGGTLGDGTFLGDTPGAFNGWIAQPVLLRAIQHDWPNQRIQYTGVAV